MPTTSVTRLMAAPSDAVVDDDETPVGVPPVVAVVVTFNPGPWLEEALDALADQDYPDLSVLVIDAASDEDPTPRIAQCLPAAFVRRLDSNQGFAASANDVIGVVEGASHYVFLHDDAAPDPDAVRLLVEEAFRSNAGIVSPKLVEWEDPARLLGVGAAADKGGVVRPYGRHELDQEQHDAVRDVFVAPGGCTLVRADLFETLGGFDAALPQFGEDLDLSWRAQVLGARVVVAPAARVRHLEATVSGNRPLVLGAATGPLRERIARLQLRHRLRAVLKSYGPVHLGRVLPQLILIMGGEAFGALVSGRRRLAGAVFDAWRWNFAHGRELRSARSATQKQRSLRDSEIRRLQTRGSVRLSAALQGGLAAEERTFGVAAASRQLAGAVATGGPRLTLGVWLSLAAVLLIGSRNLLSGKVPAVGQFVPFPESPLTLLRMFFSGWRTSGLGGEAPAPFAFALLGFAGVVLGGAMGLLQKTLVIGLLPVGIIGAHRLTGPLGSWRARLVGAVLYAAVPLPYDALARGRWAGLIAYAAAPWVLARLLRATGLAPFGAPAPDEAVVRRTPSRAVHRPTDVEAIEDLLGAEAGTMDPIDTEELRVAVAAMAGRHELEHDHDHGSLFEPDDDLEPLPTPIVRNRGVVAAARAPGSLVHQAVAAGILLAVVGAFVPALPIATVIAALGIVVGGLVLGDLKPGLRSLGVAAGGGGVAAVLLVPWTLELVLPGATWAGVAGAGAPAADAPSLGQLVRFGTGPFGGSPLGWAFLVAAALPLLLGRGWRFTFATRLWMIAAMGWGIAWAAGRGWLGVAPPAVDVLLAPAACALVLAIVMGLSAFEIDLPDYQFGWRQAASITAAAAAAIATLPVLAGALDGQWRLPRRDYADLLSWMPERQSEGAFRVLWAGDARALPLDGWRLDDGLAYGTSRGGPPDLAALWPASDQGATGLLADALQVARRGETSRLGHLLAPLGVRFIAVPLRPAPGPGQPQLRAPDDLLAALRAQIDLKLLDTGTSLVIYENAAWAPVRSVLPPAAIDASAKSGPEAARTTELAGAKPVLKELTPTRYSGAWPGGELYFSEAYSPRWGFDAGGKTTHRKAFGWANAFTAGSSSDATLRYRTSPIRYAALLLELALWVFAIRRVARGALVRRETDAVIVAEPAAVES